MGWSIGFDSKWKRDIGYGVPAWCDHPKCNEEINRGLGYVCGNAPYGGEYGCGLYFCSKHLLFSSHDTVRCLRCHTYKKPYQPKPDRAVWIEHKLSDPSWKQWRRENPGEVKAMKAHIKSST